MMIRSTIYYDNDIIIIALLMVSKRVCLSTVSPLVALAKCLASIDTTLRRYPHAHRAYCRRPLSIFWGASAHHRYAHLHWTCHPIRFASSFCSPSWFWIAERRIVACRCVGGWVVLGVDDVAPCLPRGEREGEGDWRDLSAPDDATCWSRRCTTLYSCVRSFLRGSHDHRQTETAMMMLVFLLFSSCVFRAIVARRGMYVRSMDPPKDCHETVVTPLLPYFR